MEKEEKNIKWLNNKVWYRLLKIIYILFFGWFIFLSIVGVVEVSGDSYYGVLILLFIGWIFVFIGFEIVKRAFYYIVIGTIKPSDDNCFKKLRKNRKIIIVLVFVVSIIIFIGGLFVDKTSGSGEGSGQFDFSVLDSIPPKTMISYDTANCERKKPLLVTIENVSTIPISELVGVVSVYRKGYSTDLSYNGSKIPIISLYPNKDKKSYFLSDKIINPKEIFSFCTSYTLRDKSNSKYFNEFEFKIGKMNVQWGEKSNNSRTRTRTRRGRRTKIRLPR